MKAHNDKSPLRNLVGKAKGEQDSFPALQLPDNRPEAMQMRSLQQLTDKGNQVRQLKAIQKAAADNIHAKQVAQLQFVIQKNGDDKPPVEGSMRPALGQKLMRNVFGSNWFATGVFKAMNFAMYAEGQPLTPEHNAVLEEALINNKKGLLDTLIAENPHVMKSSGRTPVYLMGKYLVHTPLEYYLKSTHK